MSHCGRKHKNLMDLVSPFKGYFQSTKLLYSSCGVQEDGVISKASWCPHMVQSLLRGIHLGNTHMGSLLLMHLISVELGCWLINAVHEGLRCCVGTQWVLLPLKTPLTWNLIY